MFFQSTGEVPKSFIYIFSFIESGKILLKYDKNNEYNVLNVWKALIMLAILFGHRFMYLVGSLMGNPKFIEHVS